MRPLVHRRAKRNPDDIEGFVFKALQASATPLSAYQLADRLSDAGTKLSAMQAYRTLGRLMVQGKVQRIEMLSAYAAKDDETDVTLVCDRCQAVRQLVEPKLKRQIEVLAGLHGFAIDDVVLEIIGRCASCRE